MSRLPTPGQDNGVWGDILNDFLSVSFGSDGTLKERLIGDDQVSSLSRSKIVGLVPGLNAKASNGTVVHNSGNETVEGVKTFGSSPVVPTPSNNGDAANKTYVDVTAQAALDMKADKTSVVALAVAL
jgi:hypothetical protein